MELQGKQRSPYLRLDISVFVSVAQQWKASPFRAFYAFEPKQRFILAPSFEGRSPSCPCSAGRDKLLGKGVALDLAIKCPRCGTINHLRNTNPNPEPHDGQKEKACRHCE